MTAHVGDRGRELTGEHPESVVAQVSLGLVVEPGCAVDQRVALTAEMAHLVLASGTAGAQLIAAGRRARAVQCVSGHLEQERIVVVEVVTFEQRERADRVTPITGEAGQGLTSEREVGILSERALQLGFGAERVAVVVERSGVEPSGTDADTHDVVGTVEQETGEARQRLGIGADLELLAQERSGNGRVVEAHTEEGRRPRDLRLGAERLGQTLYDARGRTEQEFERVRFVVVEVVEAKRDVGDAAID